MTTRLIYLLISLYVGGFMLYGGYQKFAKPLPPPTQMIDNIEREGITKAKQDPKLVIKNYIFGMKQTGYFWYFLGGCELVLGILVLSQYFSFLGAVMLTPITLQILLFHVFLEPDDVIELAETGALFAGNLALIARQYPHWKHLLIQRN